MWINYHFLYKSKNTVFLFLVFPPKKEYPEYFINNFKNLRKTYKNIHIFIISWFYRDGYMQANLVKEYCDSYTILANSMDEYLFYKLNKLNSIYCHHNAFLDENLFKLMDVDKKYDIVLNANNELIKKHYLLKNLTSKYNTLFITYDSAPNHINDLTTYGVDILKNINSTLVASYLNICKIGLYFTYIDGGCYASSEYLLCGLPVISTISKGGRDIWYNKKNSIIINPNEIELDDAIKYILDNYDSYDKNEIRKEHILKQFIFRNHLITYIQNMFNDLSLNEDVKNIFEENFINKMLDSKPATSDFF